MSRVAVERACGSAPTARAESRSVPVKRSRRSSERRYRFFSFMPRCGRANRGPIVYYSGSSTPTLKNLWLEFVGEVQLASVKSVFP